MSAAVAFSARSSLKVAELWEKNDSLFCPLAVTVDLIVSVGDMVSDATMHTHTLRVDGHSSSLGSQMVLQVLFAPPWSE